MPLMFQRIALIELIALLSSFAHGSWFEQCVFSGSIESDPEPAESKDGDARASLKFDFMPMSAITVKPSYIRCEDRVGQLIAVSLPRNDLSLRKGDRLLLHYYHHDFECADEGERCC